MNPWLTEQIVSINNQLRQRNTVTLAQ